MTTRISKTTLGLLLTTLLATWQLAMTELPRTPAPEGAKVYFITPEDGTVRPSG